MCIVGQRLGKNLEKFVTLQGQHSFEVILGEPRSCSETSTN